VKFLGGVLAMGTGLALGREGPTVQMGAGIGHLLATAFRRNQGDVKRARGRGATRALAIRGCACCDGRCVRGAARMVWAWVGRWRRRDHAAHARRGDSILVVGGVLLVRFGLGPFSMRQGRRADCLRRCQSLGLKAVLSWEHSSAAGSLTWLNAQQPLPLSAWRRASQLSCVLR
jgi:hypothetical protein